MKDKCVRWGPYVLGALLWLLLTYYLIKWEQAAGQLFIVVSIFILIYLNTNVRKEGEEFQGLSAYSVFNPNCEALPGTLSGQQLDAELRHDAMYGENLPSFQV